jgi:hypothetical protein
LKKNSQTLKDDQKLSMAFAPQQIDPYSTNKAAAVDASTGCEFLFCLQGYAKLGNQSTTDDNTIIASHPLHPRRHKHPASNAVVCNTRCSRTPACHHTL